MKKQLMIFLLVVSTTSLVHSKCGTEDDVLSKTVRVVYHIGELSAGASIGIYTYNQMHANYSGLVDTVKGLFNNMFSSSFEHLPKLSMIYASQLLVRKGIKGLHKELTA